MVFGDVTRHLVLRRGAPIPSSDRPRHLAVVARRGSVDVGVVPALETAQAGEAEQAEEAPETGLVALTLVGIAGVILCYHGLRRSRGRGRACIGNARPAEGERGRSDDDGKSLTRVCSPEMRKSDSKQSRMTYQKATTRYCSGRQT